MKSFEHLLSLLATIPDPRRAEGKLYQLRHVLLFSIFAMISGANSYRSLRTYFNVHRQRLNEAFDIDWKSAPVHTAIRYILHRLSAAEVEKVFREHAADLNCAPAGANARVVAFDGKTLKGSFDRFSDRKARQVLSDRRRYGAGAGAYRDRRKIQRNPRHAKVAAGTRLG